MIFQAKRRGKELFPFKEKAIENKILLDLRSLSVRK